MAISFRLFSPCPQLSKVEGKLVARSPWRVWLLTLGGYFREVVVDPRQKEVIVSTRYLWVFTRRQRVRFKAVEAVTYGYQGWPEGGSWAADEYPADRFSVGLRLPGGDECHLFTFSNDGMFSDPERESRAFVESLAEMIGAPVVPARG